MIICNISFITCGKKLLMSHDILSSCRRIEDIAYKLHIIPYSLKGHRFKNLDPIF